MIAIPEPVARMIKHPDTHKVLTTVTPDGKPHAIVCASLSMLGDDTILVADVFMHRTSDNLNNNPNVEILVWQGKVGYSLKAVATGRVVEGPSFDKMVGVMERFNLTPIAVWEFKVLEIWDESATASSGTQVA
ncbi:MAG: pyridoxamine 5'-phosphate oxidase family protein [Candidatus Methanomethylophilaceae archaeon]|nr:pyridoxamine 5'-phosphate oxidase family protein [Candidatus Methanomethylophilaceae archaeon]MBP5686081.1 pyridoxamine 5'-phosphate oxidase family protein [Candidatus Methanomethylophilaceae archaeon]MBP5734927.1 pyridoxamine 5'-phosphate oxidase family protein [Candidatus Methanomethylophilaceae archaeon]